MEEIIEMCKICQIHDKIMSMSEGYDTQVGELGGKLSGGERQRISIARSLLKKDAKIFLFDEATSSLDPYTEKKITDALDTMMEGKTVIYCAHRLSSIKNVKKIHVLKDGKVQEVGNHNELFYKTGSIYRQMWNDFLQDQSNPTEKMEELPEPQQGEEEEVLIDELGNIDEEFELEASGETIE